jgi:3-oxoacyl-[acyl-carrier-protein] synthase III
MSRAPQAFLDGLSVALGRGCPLEAAPPPTSLPPGQIEELRAMGFDRFHLADSAATVIYADAVRRALTAAEAEAEEIGRVLFAPPGAHWSEEREAEVLQALSLCGFEQVDLLGCGLQSCSAGAAILGMAALFLRERPEPILAIWSGLANRGETRFSPALSTFFGDAVCAAILRPDWRPLGLLGAATVTRPQLAGLDRAKHAAAYMELSAEMLVAAVETCLSRAGTPLSEVGYITSSNLNAGTLDGVSLFLDVDPDIVRTADLPVYAHAFSCDPLIGLANAYGEGRLRPGEKVLLVGWSPCTAGAALVGVSIA